MRVLGIAFALLLVSACNDIDGRLRVLHAFSLVDEDGRTRQIDAGNYSADFSYDRSKKEVELEIDDFDDGKDIDFEFHVPHMSDIDFHSDEIEIEVPALDNGQNVDMYALITREREDFGPYRAYLNEYCYDPDALYYRPFVVYDIIESRVEVDIEISRSTNADESSPLLATFTASDCRRDSIERYCIDCYGNVSYACHYRYAYTCN